MCEIGQREVRSGEVGFVQPRAAEVGTQKVRVTQ